MELGHVEVGLPKDLGVPLACRHAASPDGFDQGDQMMRVAMMKRCVSERGPKSRPGVRRKISCVSGAELGLQCVCY